MAWQTLVSAEQVADRLGDPRLLVFDCRYELARPDAGREAYLRGHLPGAIHADLHHDLAGPTTPTQRPASAARCRRTSQRGCGAGVSTTTRCCWRMTTPPACGRRVSGG